MSLPPKSPSASKSKPKTPSAADRFIPLRSSMDLDACRFVLSDSAASSSKENPSAEKTDEYEFALKRNLFSESDTSKVLTFREKAPQPAAEKGYESSLRVLYSQHRDALERSRKMFRQIPQSADRILDAPGLRNDFYLNLLDWSSQNVVAICLGPSVYLWNATTGSISELLHTAGESDFATSVKWSADGSYLSVGMNLSDVQLWDVRSSRQLRSMKGHTSRVGSLAWNGHILSSGSRDASIFHHDVRVAQHHIETLSAHQQEVCGLSWSPDGSQLASGGNDNLVAIWDGFSGGEEPAHRLEAHVAAVKALAWCPWQRHLLATGGGTADRTMKFWNSSTGALLNSVDTKSQVCSVVWNPHEREVLSAHGFSQNQLSLWKYPSLVKMGELTGHSERVLATSLSPDGSTVVSAAGDETLRFWKVFPNDSEVSSEKRVDDGVRRGSASAIGDSMRIR